MCNKNKNPTVMNTFTALRDGFTKLKTIIKPFTGKGEIKQKYGNDTWDQLTFYKMFTRLYSVAVKVSCHENKKKQKTYKTVSLRGEVGADINIIEKREANSHKC